MSIELKSAKQVIEEAGEFVEGRQLSVFDYINSKGEKSDLELTLLSRDGYRKLQEESLNTAIEAAKRPPQIENVEGAVIADILSDVIGSLTKSLSPAAGEDTGRPQAAYEPVREGSSVCTLASAEGVAYVLRLVSEAKDQTPVQVAVGAKPSVVKAAVKKALGLATENYVHVIKLEDGKFDRVVLR
jgi:hypothetical protein